MIAIDTSVMMKWFKPGERFEAEALDLANRIDGGEVEAAASEIVSLEIVRGLRRAQVNEPQLGITTEQIENVFTRIEALLHVGNILECTVGEIKVLAKDIEIALGLFMADAIHLATALYLSASHLVVDDHHFLAPEVIAYARGFGVRIVNLPDLIRDLNAARAGSP